MYYERCGSTWYENKKGTSSRSVVSKMERLLYVKTCGSHAVTSHYFIARLSVGRKSKPSGLTDNSTLHNINHKKSRWEFTVVDIFVLVLYQVCCTGTCFAALAVSLGHVILGSILSRKKYHRTTCTFILHTNTLSPTLESR